MLVLSFDIGIKNLAYCLMEYLPRQKENNFFILDWNVLDCSENEINGNNIIRTMVNKLDQLKYLYEVEIILIEKQPSFNPKMRVINSCILMYYTIRTIENEIKCKIINYSPKHKLHCCDLKVESKLKSKYQRTKKTGIEHTRFLLKNNNWIKYFESNNKKDDLSDCFLQGLSYCMKN